MVRINAKMKVGWKSLNSQRQTENCSKKTKNKKSQNFQTNPLKIQQKIMIPGKRVSFFKKIRQGVPWLAILVNPDSKKVNPDSKKVNPDSKNVNPDSKKVNPALRR